jgi:hypothetical protein
MIDIGFSEVLETGNNLLMVNVILCLILVNMGKKIVK